MEGVTAVTAEEFQTLVLHQLQGLQQNIANIDSRLDHLNSQMGSLDSRNAKIEECIAIQQNDLMKLLEIIHEEMAAQEDVDYIVKTQAEQSKMLSLLSARSMQQEAELEYLRLAK
ncbi:MAG: hypothetical protein K0Q75_2296 [Anaerospora sp.]|nr:hypothetical protein [Anaerospora sp.]